MKTSALLSFTACGIGLLLSGCAGGTPPPNPLAGNWLIVGPMPTDPLAFPPQAGGFRLAMTVDVIGNNIAAAGFANASCQPGPSLPPVSVPFGPFAVTGPIAADGSFSVQIANFTAVSGSIQGKAPLTHGGQWPGSYTASLTPASKPPCLEDFAGTFTATSFPLVNGVYAGTGSLDTLVNGVQESTPVSFQVTLKQGGTLLSVTGESISSNMALTGSIRVQGSPCFTSGVMSSFPQSGVAGNLVYATFMMDDGSTLRIIGAVTDATETRIATNVALVTAGQCGKVSDLFKLPELDRQS
jgi:hypothetical protein